MTDVSGAVLVTGANGFIGGTLRARLRHDGVEVRGVDLVPGDGVVRGDTTEPAPWKSELDRVDTVVHTAAIVTFAGDADRFWRVNVLGTRRVIEAAAAAGVRRVVVLSSIVVYGFDVAGSVDETWPVRPNGSPYVDTKVATEQVALQAHAAGEVEVVVIRPGDVYGPGSRPWVTSPIEELRRGRSAIPSGGGVLNLVHVDDLVDAVVRSVRVEEAGGQVINVTGADAVPVIDYFTRLAAMTGVAPPRQLPAALLRPAADAVRRIDLLRGRTTDVSSFAVDYLARTARVSHARAMAVLGWRPAVGLAEGLQRTATWLHDEGIA